jgi:hypothetical protein
MLSKDCLKRRFLKNALLSVDINLSAFEMAESSIVLSIFWPNKTRPEIKVNTKATFLFVEFVFKKSFPAAIFTISPHLPISTSLFRTIVLSLLV